MNPNPANDPWSERLKIQFQLPLDKPPLDKPPLDRPALDELALRNGWELSNATDFAPETYGDEAYADEAFNDNAYGDDAHYDGLAYDPTVDELYLTCDAPVYLPESYEPNYAYPLIIWLNGAEQEEHDPLDLMPQISDQNFVAVSVRGQLPASDQPSAVDAKQQVQRQPTIDSIEQEVYTIVCQLRRQVHIHSERIYVAGLGGQATLAVQMLLQQPEWFAGALAFGGRIPDMPHPLARFRDLAGKRILIQAGARNPSLAMPDVVKMGRLLHSAGMSVSTRVYDADQDVSPKMLTDVNHWMMDGIRETNLV